MSYQDIDDCYTGIVLTFQTTENFTKSKKKNTLSGFLAARLKGQYSSLLALVLLGLLLVAPGIVVPVFSQFFVDEILLGGNTDWLVALLAIMAGTLLFKAILTYYRSRLLQKIQNKLILLSAYRFLSHLFRLPISFFDQRAAGDISNRVENNNNVSTFITGSLAETALNILVALFYLLLLLMYSPILTSVGLACVSLNLLVMYFSSRALSDVSMKAQQDQGKLVGALLSGLTLTSTLKASGTENDYISRLQGYYAKSITTEQQMGRLQEILNAIPEVSKNLTDVLTLMIGGILVIRGDMTAGMLVAYNSLLASFTEPVNAMASFIQNIQTTRADMNRVDDIMRYQQDPKFNETNYQPLKRKLMGDIELDSVAFGYDILKPPLVKDFHFSLKGGSSIAFVGASGCGKSTVSKLCSGLYLPWEGEIRIDGCPISEIPPEVLSSSVSTVSQNITLFSGTIRENLTMWDHNLLEADIIKAAKDACIHDVITTKPGAYEYMLTEGGANLSGGQRQRLEIARALATNPSVLIMDEATSALDPIVEKKIIDNIKRRGCTCIIVAHRLSAIRDCDEILLWSVGELCSAEHMNN